MTYSYIPNLVKISVTVPYVLKCC